MDEQNVIYSYNGILFSNEKEQTTDTYYTYHSVMQNKEARYKTIYYKIPFVWKVQKRQIYRDIK